MTTALPPHFALAAYRTVLNAEEACRPATPEDRGSLLDLVVGLRTAAKAPAGQPAWLGAAARCLPLTAASGC
jgi:hypothetical protein